MKRLLAGLTLLGCLLAVGSSESAVIRGSGGGASTLQQAFDGGNTITGATEAKPLKIRGSGAQSANGWNFYQHSNGTPTIKCVVAEVEGACDVTVSLNAGKKYLIKDSLGTTLFTVDEATGDVTIATAGQLIASNLGIEFAESDTNPTCAAGNYNIYADTSETTLKKCVNGVASVLASGGSTIVRKTADETVNNSAVSQADDHLLFAVDANSYYTFRALILYSSSTVADLRLSFTVPAGATGRNHLIAPSTSATACSGAIPGNMFSDSITNTHNGVGGVGVATICSFEMTGVVAVAGTSGTVTFTWAQSVAEVSDTKIRADSYISWSKL